MKVCMVGLGSIGTRHLKNLISISSELGISLEIDALRSGNNQLPPDIVELLSTEYFSYDETPDDYDIVFITNPTALHYDSIDRVLSKTKHLFIEKPIFDKIDYEYMSLQWKKDGVYYTACPLRYHSVIKYLKEFVQENKVYSVRCICSSYLPDWRPDVDYKQSYSALSELGGGVRGDIIHEWDYLQYLFGPPLEVNCQYGKFSHLDITSEDSAVYIAKYMDKLISLHLDYFGRFHRREIELFIEDDVIVGDMVNNQVKLLKSGEIISLPQERSVMQKEELACFLDMVKGKSENINDVATAVSTLKLAMGVYK